MCCVLIESIAETGTQKIIGIWKVMALWTELDTFHIQINKQTYECLICENDFNSPVQLTIHCIVVHRLLPCPQCLKLLENENALDNHIRTHHNNESSTTVNRSDVTNSKACTFCELSLPADQLWQHNQQVHKITEPSGIKQFDLRSGTQFGFQCHLCVDQKSANRLDKHLSHFVYFHKCSLPSLVRCILNNNAIDSIRSVQICDDTAAHLKCTVCGLHYTWSTPKVYHKIYCHGHIYCTACGLCFEKQDGHYDHLEHCQMNSKKTDFCDNCNSGNDTTDQLHIQQVHKYSKTIPLKNLSSLLNSENYCNLCEMNLKIEATNPNDLIEHFRNFHKISALAILSYLKKRNDAKIHSIVNDYCIKVVEPADESKNIRTVEDLKKEPAQENQSHVTNSEYIMDFDTKIVRHIYSSESDYDSADSVDETSQPIKTFRCELCRHRSKSKFAHGLHLHKKHGFLLKPFEFRCNACRKNFASRQSLKKHNRKIHHKQGAEKRFSCPFCAFSSNGKSKMRYHVSEHVESNYYPCSSKTLGFNCRYCHFVFWTREKLNEHEMYRHPERASETYLLCSHCFVAFNNLSTFRNHSMIRHAEDQHPQENTFQCTICRIVLCSIAALRIHMDAMHPRLQSIFCAKQKCRQAVTNVEELNTHWANVHPNIAQPL